MIGIDALAQADWMFRWTRFYTADSNLVSQALLLRHEHRSGGMIKW